MKDHENNKTADLFPEDLIISRLMCESIKTKSTKEGVFFQMRLQGMTNAMRESDLLIEQSLNDWERVMSPVINPIEQLAKNSTDYDDFMTGLTDLIANNDPQELIDSLAKAAFKTRGIGEAI